MSGLSQEARALIDGMAELDGPAPSDRARIQQRLTSQLGAAAFATSMLASASAGSMATVGVSSSAGGAAAAANGLASVAPKSFWLGGFGKALIGVAALGGVGIAWWIGTPPGQQQPVVAARQAASGVAAEPPSRELPGQVAPAAPAANEPAALEGALRPEAAQPNAKAALRAKAGTPEPKLASAPSDTLRAELALLGRAQAALRAGRFQEAFALASEHRGTFPDGMMKEERMGVAALAECALSPERRVEARAFLQQAASSPLAARVRKACELP